MLRVKFIEKAVGREAGTIEDVPDDTLARTWEEAGFVEVIDAPAAVEDRSLAGPPRNRAMKSPKES